MLTTKLPIHVPSREIDGYRVEAVMAAIKRLPEDRKTIEMVAAEAIMSPVDIQSASFQAAKKSLI